VKNLRLLLLLIVMAVNGLHSQNAPVTTAGYVTNATTTPGSVVVPVTVSAFANIGCFTLALRYKANRVTYVSASSHPSFPGMTVTNTVVGTVGKLVIHWPQTAGGVTLPDGTHLLDLTFTYLSSTSSLVWVTTDTNCYYKKYSGGSYVLLNDSPELSYYINGGISNRGAPLTYAPTFLNPSPGNISVPLTVDNFSSVGAITLNLAYDPAVLTYQSCTMNSSLGGSGTIGTNPGPDGKLLVTISWTIIGGTSLSNGSTLATIIFSYSNTNGTWSGLDFYDTSSYCDYADQYANTLIDTPSSSYYHNGLVYTQYAPRAWLPVKMNAIPSGTVALPVYVNDFNNVRSFSLTFEYDGTVMTYSSFTPDAAFGSGLTASDSPSGTKRKLAMTWTGTANKTLPAGSLVGTVYFNYISGSSALSWLVTDGTSCRFNDSGGSAFCDAPKSTYYKDGLVASHVAPVIICNQQSAISNQQITMPVLVYDFTNIGLFSLTLDYDPSVLSYQGATLVPAIGGTFTASASGSGRVVMNWSGTATTLADSTTLANVVFNCSGGSTTLAWNDDGSSCMYAETSSGSSLYDLPQSQHYVNGYAGPSPITANFTANITAGDVTANVSLTDLSTGSPQSWNWVISPSTYYFINGTTSSSQNPQIKFTSNGGYTVMLIITKGTGAAARFRKEYLHIGTPGLWTGITSCDWNTTSNWHNYIVPGASVNVTVPDVDGYFPSIGSSLAIGSACGNVTLHDGASLSVSGDLQINPSHSLTFEGTGTIYLGGSWSDSGTFNSGNGTVEFNGANNSLIYSGTTPESFYKIVVSKAGTARLSIQGNVHVTSTEIE
jgi:PKD repeat protein